ncbi:MAG: DUF2283 domain-containing protein [archaeon]
MKIEFDKDIDAAYIYIEDSNDDKKSEKTIEVNKDIILDFNSEEKLIGIEVLNASKNLTKSFLTKNLA